MYNPHYNTRSRTLLSITKKTVSTQTTLSVKQMEELVINKRKYSCDKNPMENSNKRIKYDENTEEDEFDYNESETDVEEDEEDEEDEEEEDEEDEDEEDEEDEEEEEEDEENKENRYSKKNKTILIPIKFSLEEEDENDEYKPKKDKENCFPDKHIYKYTKSLTKKELLYFTKLSEEEQHIYVKQDTAVSFYNDTSVPLRFKILRSKLDEQSKSIAIRKLNLMNQMPSSNGEKTKYQNLIENLMKVPFGKYKELPVTNLSSSDEISSYINKTKDFFKETIYGHDDAKNQIIRILAQWIANPNSKGNVIGIHGSPGVGKTTLVKDCVCRALDLPFQFIPLGGASDGSYLDGHGFTYEGSTWGKITDSLIKANCMNPVLYFDELDKVSKTERGQELINILIHLTDPSQNDQFFDKYFSDIPFDLSKCLIVFTYNNDDCINPILKDRMIRISAKDYNKTDKLEIAKKFIIPEMKNQFSIKKEDVVFSEDILNYIISKTPVEAGVRNLKRSIELILSNINLSKMMYTYNENSNKIDECFTVHDESKCIYPVILNEKIVNTFIPNVSKNTSHLHMYL
jgi:ATP-dependent Lon protease